ncbi:hypothetical protein DENSPDRAFT_593056 [Dentipellis sp. KUC8613]|nr:hypothetical protein DENSPDRAFT_593056 [Dentipellis sp. KUC8613]
MIPATTASPLRTLCSPHATIPPGTALYLWTTDVHGQNSVLQRSLLTIYRGFPDVHLTLRSTAISPSGAPRLWFAAVHISITDGLIIRCHAPFAFARTASQALGTLLLLHCHGLSVHTLTYDYVLRGEPYGSPFLCYHRFNLDALGFWAFLRRRPVRHHESMEIQDAEH